MPPCFHPLRAPAAASDICSHFDGHLDIYPRPDLLLQAVRHPKHDTNPTLAQSLPAPCACLCACFCVIPSTPQCCTALWCGRMIHQAPATDTCRLQSNRSSGHKVFVIAVVTRCV
jgi:hypothetical protein